MSRTVLNIRNPVELNIVAYTYNPSTWEAVVGGLF